ncbi:NAD dependent epimerase/dehydratase family protein [Toxoplasma gondii GT1]|uniref:NAD dependent epimerase/dehydratase family protein n=5 Tax=Toxoplasma gondii TaxID=5811 RepID=S7V147_TOXGG|nr:NAD dependent epimerase/dehydratase family protein [Toxoplasma gondii GT1]KAF4638443.1 NAD dependent epimerase/dehydratase family protein [Toxoplasma gondii]RQX71926.1 NAD dependent epimerase/dehydratase family protein [Toxoplasma gondii CAST]
MAALVKAASNLFSPAKPLFRDGSDGENEYFTVVISGSHGMLGGFLIDMFRDGNMKIDGRPVRCRRLVRTRGKRRSSQGMAFSRSRTKSSTAPGESALPPRPAFLPSASFVDAAEKAEDSAESSSSEETLRRDAKSPSEVQDAQVPADPSAEETRGATADRQAASEADPTAKNNTEEDEILWDIPNQWIEAEKLEGVDAVIHLAGEPLAEKGEVAGELAPDRASLASSRGGAQSSEAVSGVEGEGAETGPDDEVPTRDFSGGWGGQKLRSFLSGEEWLRSLGAWTDAKKKEIMDSRVNSIRLLVDAFKRLKRPPKTFFVASGVGVYGIDHGDEICDDETAAGTTFISEVSVRLEQEAAKAASRQSSVFEKFVSPESDLPEQLEQDLAGNGALNCRVVFLRFGVMLSTRGGMLPRLLPLYKMRFGARLGDGRQWMSWVSLRDAARAVVFLLEKEQAEIQGPVNVCAPAPMRNEDFAAEFHKVLHPRAWFTFTMPVPAWLLRMVLGQLADEVLLGGQRAAPGRLSEADFTFDHPSVAEALLWSLEDQKSRKTRANEEKEGGEGENEHTEEERVAALDRLTTQQLELAEQMREQDRKQEEKRHELLLKRRQSSKTVDPSLQPREERDEEAGDAKGRAAAA